MRKVHLLALVATTALLLPAAGTGTASAAGCKSMRGTLVKQTKTIRLVKLRASRGRTIYRACARRSAFQTPVTTYIRKRGEKVTFLRFGPSALTFRVTSGTAGNRRRTDYFHNVENLVVHRYWDWTENVDCTQDFQAAQPPPVRTIFGAGRLVVVYSPVAVSEAEAECYPNSGHTLIVVYGIGEEGEPLAVEPIADLPLASVRVVGRTLSWTVAGEARSYEL